MDSPKVTDSVRETATDLVITMGSVRQTHLVIQRLTHLETTRDSHL